jgi:hypothetical protein
MRFPRALHLHGPGGIEHHPGAVAIAETQNTFGGPTWNGRGPDADSNLVWRPFRLRTPDRPFTFARQPGRSPRGSGRKASHATPRSRVQE